MARKKTLPDVAKVAIDNGRLDVPKNPHLVELSQLVRAYTSDELASIDSLFVSGCTRLKSTAGIEAMPNLEHFRVERGRITDTAGLDQLTKLRTLFLPDQKITKLRCPSTALEVVDLGSNAVMSFTDLELSPTVHKLVLDRNAITSLAPIGAFPALTWVALYGNQISKIEALELLPKLERITLHGNPAREITPESLAVMREGRARGLDVSLDDELEETYGLVPTNWMLVVPVDAKELEAAALAKWREFLGKNGEPVPWNVASSTRSHVYLTSKDLVGDFAQNFFSELGRTLSRSGKAYVIDLRPGERNRTGVRGWFCFEDGKMVMDDFKGTPRELAAELGCTPPAF